MPTGADGSGFRAWPTCPSGAVTFLFTDIEGSTRLVKQLRDGYAAVLGDHQRLLRAAFVAHGGYEVDTQGDSFFVAFASAREALCWRLSKVSVALLSHTWPEGVEIKVRMGLHTGQAVASDGRYTGLAVHRAARIGAAGHGGQILVSQATQTLLEDEEEDLHVFLRDLGEQRLKDLDRPVGSIRPSPTGCLRRSRLFAVTPTSPQAAEASDRPAIPATSTLAARRARGVRSVSRRSRRLLVLAGWLGRRSGRDPAEPRRADRSANERDRRRDPGRDPSGPGRRGRGLGLGRQPRGSDADEDRPGAALGRGDDLLGEPDADGNRSRARCRLGRPRAASERSRRSTLSSARLTRSIQVAGTAFGSPDGSVALDESSVWVVFGDSTLARLDGAGQSAGRDPGRLTAGGSPRHPAVRSG